MAETNNNLAIHTIMKIIWENAPISRAEISRMSGFSRSTITLNVDRLLKIGLLSEKPKKGSKRNSLAINSQHGVVVGVEMGAHSCEIGICDLTAKLLENRTFHISYATGPEYIQGQLIEELNHLLAKRRPILGIGIGLPSPVDFEKGCAIHPAFMPGWHLFPIKGNLEKHFGCPVFVDNEVNTMALGESFLSKDFRTKSILFVKAGTAIGAGLIIDGDIYRGNSGLSGNIGHIQIEGNTELCRCGKRGCLESIAGGEAIAKHAEALAREGRSTILADILAKKGTLTAKDVRDVAATGDETSLSIIREAAQALGTILGKLVVFFDPKAVIIGGGLTGFGPQYIGYIRSSIMTQCTPWVKSDFIVKKSELGESIGTIGSAMLCIRQLMAENYLVKE
jgi:predicted NBD/HSP70 family sugar kinase